MFEKMVPVNKDVHAHTRVGEISSFAFASKLHVADVTMQEFTRAAAIFPIVFVEDTDKDEFRPVVLLGLSVGQNLFVDAAGKWRGSYVPAVIRRYPFALVPGDADGQYLVCIDEASSLVSTTQGAALFDDRDEPTQVIDNVKRYLSELQQMQALTHGFARFLAQHNLFTPMNLSVRDNSQVRNILGCYVINEERLNNLSDALFLEIKNQRYLPAVYAHLISLAQTERLVKLQDEAGAKGA
ncbi:MAG: SapC family protein [Rhodoferax sp.]|nr:SapC family protein [Rhodoferax sp.]